MPNQRKHFTAEEKVSILRQHFLEKAPISAVCEQAGIQPSLFYQWQKQFFENSKGAFQSNGRTPKQDPVARRIADLERQLHARNEALAELPIEHLALRSTLAVSSEGRFPDALTIPARRAELVRKKIWSHSNSG